MRWNDSAITNEGIAMLRESLAGKTLYISRVSGGTGTVPPASLMAQTALVLEKQELSIVDMAETESGKQVKIQITSKGLEVGYPLNQVGIWAHLEDEPVKLFAILQDDGGVNIPAQADIPEFLMEFYAIIACSQYAEIVVHVDPVASVTMATMEEALAKKEDLIRKAGLKQIVNDADYIVLSVDDTTKRISFEKFLETLTGSFDIRYQSEQQVRNLIKAYASTLYLKEFDFTIPVGAWLINEDATDKYHRYYADVLNEKLQTEFFPDVLLTDESLEAAADCGLCPNLDTPEDGVLRVYSQEIPTADISGACRILCDASGGLPAGGIGGGGSGSYVLPVASDITLGGVKIGDGVNVEEDGTISVDEVGVVESAVENAIESVSETDDGANEMLDEVFNP